MRLLALTVVAAAGCTTVVQEPADLTPAAVEALSLADEGGGAVRIQSPEGWGEAGATVHVANRLTGAAATASLDAAGTLEVSIAGRLDDVFAISLREHAPHAPQLTTAGGLTVHAWGWGFGGLDACDLGTFDAGTIEQGPPHEHEACFATAAPAPLHADREVPAVGTSRLALELLGAPVVRFRASAHVAGDVLVRLATPAGTYEAGHSVQGTAWETRSLQSREFHHGLTELEPDLQVTAIWISAEGHTPAEGLSVDDVVVESAIEAE